LAVALRLTRLGRKKNPFYRIVVMDSRKPRDGRYIESLGTYNPLSKDAVIQIDEAGANRWLDMGAVPSDTVRSLMKVKGILLRRNLRKRGFDEARIDEEVKRWESLQIQKRAQKSEKAAAKIQSKTETKAETKAETVQATESQAAPSEPQPAEQTQS
jgi:small subunit ribosomal protein S16